MVRQRRRKQVWQNACLWEKTPSRKSSTVMSGYINVTIDFLLDICEKVEDGEIELSDDNRVEIGISFRDNENPSSDSSPDYLGNLFLLDNDDDDEPPARRKTTSKSRARRSDEDEDDEPIARRKTTSKSRSRRTIDEDDEPPVRRKTSIRSRHTVDEDEDDEPVVRRKMTTRKNTRSR